MKINLRKAIFDNKKLFSRFFMFIIAVSSFVRFGCRVSPIAYGEFCWNYAGIRDFWRPRMTTAIWANKVTFADLRTLIDDLGY